MAKSQSTELNYSAGAPREVRLLLAPINGLHHGCTDASTPAFGSPAFLRCAPSALPNALPPRTGRLTGRSKYVQRENGDSTHKNRKLSRN